MAQPTFRSWVGVAKDTLNGYSTTAVIATGTTLTLRNLPSAVTGTLTTSGASYTAVIVDGVNTESTVCTGNLTGATDGSTIAVTALANAHPANVYVYFQLTASIGPTAYIPITDLDFADDYAQLADENLRGSNVKTFDVIQGMRKGAIAIGGNVFADSFGYILSPFFGAYDYTATTGGNPTTYAFSPLNTGTGQPTNYLFYDYNPGASNTRVFALARVEQIQLKLDPGALVSYTATIQSYASGIVANPSTIPPAYTSVTALPSRVGTLSIGGTVTPKLLSADLTFKREIEAIPTIQGMQEMLTVFAGRAELTGKATLVIDDDVQLLNYINRSQPTLLFTINQGATTAANGVKVQITKANYDSPTKVLQKGKPYVQLEVPFTGVANSTDKSTAGAGLSPCLVTLSTGTTTGATLY